MNDEIKTKIQKLINKAESAKELGSLKEAELFTKKVNELLLQYNLEKSDIPAGEDMFKDYKLSAPLSYRCKTAGDSWLKHLLAVICKYNLCGSFYYTHTKTLIVYGDGNNVDAVVWLYNFIRVNLIRMALEEYQAYKIKYRYRNLSRYRFVRDFVVGGADGIAAKMEETKAQHEFSDKITALTITNKEALNDYVKQTQGEIRSVKSRDISISAEAYESGFDHGKSLSLNKPLQATVSVERSLIG